MSSSIPRRCGRIGEPACATPSPAGGPTAAQPDVNGPAITVIPDAPGPSLPGGEGLVVTITTGPGDEQLTTKASDGVSSTVPQVTTVISGSNIAASYVPAPVSSSKGGRNLSSGAIAGVAIGA